MIDEITALIIIAAGALIIAAAIYTIVRLLKGQPIKTFLVYTIWCIAAFCFGVGAAAIYIIIRG